MSVSGVTASAAAALAAPESKPDSPAKVRQAVQQFEALMLTQLLKTAREAGSSAGGWFGTGEDQAGALGMEFAEQEFARMLAAGGGLGLAKVVAAGLERETKVDAR